MSMLLSTNLPFYNDSYIRVWNFEACKNYIWSAQVHRPLLGVFVWRTNPFIPHNRKSTSAAETFHPTESRGSASLPFPSRSPQPHMGARGVTRSKGSHGSEISQTHHRWSGAWETTQVYRYGNCWSAPRWSSSENRCMLTAIFYLLWRSLISLFSKIVLTLITYSSYKFLCNDMIFVFDWSLLFSCFFFQFSWSSCATPVWKRILLSW